MRLYACNILSKNFYKLEMIADKLKFLGLDEEEIQIYLTLSEYGALSVSRISGITKIGRINCYHYTEKLQEKGLIRLSQKSKVMHFSADTPKVFINREIERLNLAREVVPEIMAIAAQSPGKPKIQFFEGKRGLQNIFDQMLELRGGEIVSFSNFDELGTFMPGFLKNHFKARLDQNIKTRFISPRTEFSEGFAKQFFPKDFDQKLLEIFLISPDEFYFDSDISIFGGSIAIMNLNEKNPIGVLIENTELFRTQKAIFDLAWLGATSFITQ